MIAPISRILDSTGQPFRREQRCDLADLRPAVNRRARLSYDAASSSDEYKNIWANSDSRDADSANDITTRHRLMHRSRYEAGSNGYYAGIVSTHVNMLVNVGPTLRMLSDNQQFNRLVEREWWKWCQIVQLRRKLWCMAHARTQDGEVFGIMVTNPNILHDVTLDVVLIEGEQCQSPQLPFMQRGYIDGIKFDEFGNPEWYDILIDHPGSNHGYTNQRPQRVSAVQVLHWFKLRRPGQHRGIPDCTSSLNTGAAARRFREATLAAAETAAEPTLVLETAYQPDELDWVTPMSTLDIQKRMMMALPNSMKANQIAAEHPNAQYSEFHRQLISEQARPLSMPFNAAACDSSTYSFASGKLDTLCYRAGLDVERQDCNDLILDRLFAEWFREFVLAADQRRDEWAVSDHQWDWPAHPVIDEVSHATANEKNLAIGQTTLSQVYSDSGKDFEDGLSVMAEEWFGEATEANIVKVRKICVLRNTPAHAIDHVAQILEIAAPIEPSQTQSDSSDVMEAEEQAR